jgi:hypothetical protein
VVCPHFVNGGREWPCSFLARRIQIKSLGAREPCPSFLHSKITCQRFAIDCGPPNGVVFRRMLGPEKLVADVIERLVDRKGTVSTHKRRLLGIPQSNHHGSPNRCLGIEFNRRSRKPQLRPSQRGLECRAGTLAAFARVTVPIHGTGRRWRG